MSSQPRGPRGAGGYNPHHYAQMVCVCVSYPPNISSAKPKVTREGTIMFLTDLGSAHGTIIDGEKLEKNTPVRLPS